MKIDFNSMDFEIKEHFNNGEKCFQVKTYFDGTNKIMYGKLISNIQVLAVKDASGRPVFQNIDENRTPSMIVFAVPEEYYVLLSKASYMRTYDTDIVLVPTNESVKDEPGELEISSEQLKEWINKNTYWTEN